MHYTSKSTLLIAAVLATWISVAHAKLPPPTAEEQAAAEQKKAKAVEDAAAQKAALTKVQDQVVARYIAAQKAKGITVTPTPLAAPAAPVASTLPAPAAPVQK